MLKTKFSNDPAVQELLDREAIRDCVMLNARAIDRRDFDLLRSVYWPQATDEHGTATRPVEEFVTWVSGLIQDWPRTKHSISQMLVQVDGHKAAAETYFTAFHLRPNAQGELYDEFVSGRYLDIFEKRGGEWRIAKRMRAFDYFRHFQDPCEWASSSLGVRRMGAHKPNDIVYTLFGELAER